MHGSVDDVTVTLVNDALTIREADWGEMHVALEKYSQRFDAAPYPGGLPDDRCQCPHWGYVISGEMHVCYADREETIRAGEAYFLAPGHAVIMEANTELVEFSPQAPHAQTMEVAARNFEALPHQ